jgi:glycosyltransferase XagB
MSRVDAPYAEFCQFDVPQPLRVRHTAAAYCQILARECNLKFIDESVAPELDFRERAPSPRFLLSAPLALPLKDREAPTALNVSAFSLTHIVTLAHSLGPLSQNVGLMTRQALIDSISRTYGSLLVKRAAFGLRRQAPLSSAAEGVELWQILSLTAVAGVVLGMASVSFRDAVVFSGALLSVAFMLAVLIRAAAVLHLMWGEVRRGRTPCCSVNDPTLPIYTVLVPVHREERVLPILVDALRRLEYPAGKLDIKIIVESGDDKTIDAARALNLAASGIDLIIAPEGGPQTKPKALNYALHFATGEYLVIYDAEDQPEPKQLLKAAARFRSAPKRMSCLQASLIFHNYRENWLAKQFTIEYSSLFDGILPMLSAYYLPLPLGGTSNHFRAEALREIGAWDPHNVTEDADLGMRLYRAGYYAETLDSTTYEEAACQLGNWVRQRTRWLKGWMQTYGVHMRRPVQLYQEMGPSGFIAFQAYFAGIIVSALAHPVFYLLLAHDLASGFLFQATITPIGAPFWVIACFNFAGGYAASLVLGWITIRTRRIEGVCGHVLLIPVYWMLVSVAAYRALYQLFTAPFYWEKTEHGLSMKANAWEGKIEG